MMTTTETQTHLKEQEQESLRTRNVFRLGILTGIIYTVISVISVFFIVYDQTGLLAFSGVAITVSIATISFFSAYLAKQGKSKTGGQLIITTILIMALFLPLFSKGQGVALAFITISVISGSSILVLSSKVAARTSIASIIIGIVIIFSDYFLPDPGIPNDPRITNAIAISLGVLYFSFILWRFNTYSLQTKLIISFIATTLMPILILSFYNNSITRNILTKEAENNLIRLANQTASSIDDYLSSQINLARIQAQQPTLIKFLAEPPSKLSENQPVALQTLNTFVRANPTFILSYALLDTQGINLLSTNQSEIGNDESRYAYFRIPLKTGKPYLSDILFKQKYPSFYISVPVQNENGEITGILRGEYHAKIFQNLILSFLEEEILNSEILLVDRDKLLQIASLQESEKNYRSFKNFSDQEFLELQIQQKLPEASSISKKPADIDYSQILEYIDNQQILTIKQGVRQEPSLVITGKNLKTLPWLIITQQSAEKIYAQAEAQARANILWALGLTVFALIAAVGVTRVISSPISTLARVAEQIAAGDLSARAFIGTGDEVGRLSNIFNQMTTQLSQTLKSLEERVEQRTKELQTATQQSSQRARQLQSIADVSKMITREQNIEKLLPLITDVVSERFGYYHVGIFLLDETRRAAVLQASNSPGGQRMLANGHRLNLGTSSIVGYAALTGKPRIALDVGEDAVFFNNPNLPETHSEAALPLMARGTVIGVLDIQSKQARAFTQEDIDILSVLADQIAIAIENARLFQQTQTALQEARYIAQSFLRQEWSELARKQTTAGYLHTSTGGKVISAPVKSDEIEQAIRKGSVVKKEGKTDESTNPTLAIPITLGQQVIGVIRVQSPDRNRRWSTEEINLLRSISERVGLALDNARLVATSQKRAAKERTIEEIAAKISAATNMDAILQTAAQEIGRALSSSDVVIQLTESEEE